MTTPYTSSVSRISALEHEISVTVPALGVNKHLDRVYNEISREARIPGFRPGKVPRSILEKKFSKSALESAKEKLISESFPQALEEHKISPVGNPQIVEVKDVQGNADFSYRIKVEVLPEIEVKDINNLKVSFTPRKFNEADIEAELESARRTHATYVPVEGRSQIQEGDLVDLTYQATCEGKKIEALSHSGRVKFIEDEINSAVFAELTGKSVPCEFSVDYVMDSESDDEEFRGKTAVISGSVQSIKEMKLPALDDEFARDLSSSFTDLEALKGYIRTTLQARLVQQNINNLHRAVSEALIAENPMEIPPLLIENQARNLAWENLSFLGEKKARAFLQEHGSGIIEECKAEARKQIHASMLCMKIAQKNNLSVSEDEIKDAITNEVYRKNLKEAELKKYLTQDRVDSIKQSLLMEKTLQLVASLADKSTAKAASSNV